MQKNILGTLIGLVVISYPLLSYTPGIHDLTLKTKGVISVAQAAQNINSSEGETPKRFTVWVTAYSSTPEETDSTPFVTAQNTKVRDGIIAVNFLPFGSKVKIPKLFGDKIFTVEDRMHARKKNFVDVWMPSKEDALAFGIYRAEIVLVNQASS